MELRRSLAGARILHRGAETLALRFDAYRLLGWVDVITLERVAVRLRSESFGLPLGAERRLASRSASASADSDYTYSKSGKVWEYWDYIVQSLNAEKI